MGDDQRQHVELMRDIAERFNARFGETLVVPEHRIPAVGARIMDLQRPRARCRRPGGDAPRAPSTCTDEPAAIEKKFKRAVTDSGSEVRRGTDKPGVTNLIEILAACAAPRPRRSRPSWPTRATAI